MLRVLIACEFSGVVRRAFEELGHDAWSCDLLPAEDHSAKHFQQNVLNVLPFGWDLLIAHPPCTYLTRSGWHWVNRPDCATLPLKGEPRRQAAMEAAQFFRQLLNAPIERIAIENPLPIVHVSLPPYDQLIQPWMFGHGERKATCLWLKNLPFLQATHAEMAHAEMDLFCDEAPKERQARIYRMSPSEDRSKLRSISFNGIAAAMAEQWGAYITQKTYANR